MVQKNVKMLVFGIVLALLAGTMLVITLSNSGEPAPDRRGEILDPDDVPDITAPGGRIPGPERVEGARRP